MDNSFIEIKNLSKSFAERKLFGKAKVFLKAVDNVSLSIEKGKTLGVVGESGCGKSTLGRCLLRLVDADEGKVFYDGVDVLSLSDKDFLPYRKKMQIVFQDPYSTLNPRLSVGSILSEAVRFHKIRKGAEVAKYISVLLDKVGLNRNAVNKYPHEFSGGQRQRIAIARALAVEPEFIVCDEPVSALDVSIQSQILNLLMDLQREFGLTYLFISHNLSVVRHISESIAVMFLGRVVEFAKSDDLFVNPFHPYTRALIDAVPGSGIQKANVLLKGDLPSVVNVSKGCFFAPRCKDAMEVCSSVYPVVFEENGHFVNCHLKLK